MNQTPQSRLDRSIVWLKNNKWTSVFILVGVCIVGIGTFTGALSEIRAFVLSLVEKRPPLHERIPEDQVPLKFTYASDTRLGICEIMYSSWRSQLDVRVRNTSDETLVLNYVYLCVEYWDLITCSRMDATDVISIDVEDEIDEAKDKGEPFYLRRGYKVSYKIEPHGADRYLINLRVDPDDLFYPPYDGRYFLTISFEYNKGEHASRFVDFDRLLRKGRIVP